jgi:hypothetical protein
MHKPLRVSKPPQLPNFWRRLEPRNQSIDTKPKDTVNTLRMTEYEAVQRTQLMSVVGEGASECTDDVGMLGTGSLTVVEWKIELEGGGGAWGGPIDGKGEVVAELRDYGATTE